MSYLITFADKTSKRVPDSDGQKVVLALAKQQGVVIGGAYYAHHVISTCRPLAAWAEEQRETARASGKYFCRYGHTHEQRRECACKDAGFTMIEEISHLFPQLAPPEAEEPQTEDERRKAAAWEEMRAGFIEARSMKPGLPAQLKSGASASCKNCDGTGNWLFQGTYIACSCVTGR